MPSGGPPRGPDFGPPGPGPWGPGPGPVRGPPPHAIPPPGWPESRPTEDARDPEVAGDWKEKQNNDEEQAEEMNTVNDNITMEKPDDERDLGRRTRKEHDDLDRERSRDRSRERGRDRDDRGRDRDDRVRNRDRDERFRDRIVIAAEIVNVIEIVIVAGIAIAIEMTDDVNAMNTDQTEM